MTDLETWELVVDVVARRTVIRKKRRRGRRKTPESKVEARGKQ